MNFCKGCNFMLYTKLEKNGEELINYCKHCGLESEYITKLDDKSICVYKKNYSNDFLAEKTFTNKYTKFDPTLPRINNIVCVNPLCLSNKDKDNTIYILKKDDNKFTDIEKESLLEKFSALKITNCELYNDNELLVITFEDVIDKNSFEEKFKNDQEINLNLKILIEPPKESLREIIFIKYDYINLKYLYLCTSCNTSWNNE